MNDKISISEAPGEVRGFVGTLEVILLRHRGGSWLIDNAVSLPMSASLARVCVDCFSRALDRAHLQDIGSL